MKQPNAYPLRIDDDIMEKLKEIAKEDGRSLNKEIEFALKKFIQSYKTEKE